MPILTVVGFEPEDAGQRKGLIGALRKAVASVEGLKVVEQQVTPFLIPAFQDPPGDAIAVYVDLFDCENRTDVIRLETSTTIFNTVSAFVVKHHCKARFIEVIPHRILPTEDGYCSGYAQTGQLKFPAPKSE